MVEDWKLPQTWSLDLWITILLGVIAIVLALPSLLYASEVRRGILGAVRSHWPRLAAVCLVLSLLSAIMFRNMMVLMIAILASMALASWREYILKAAKDKALKEVDRLNALLSERIPYPKDPRGRWETVTTIRYGHLEYEPFLHYEDQKPTGLGVDLLAWLLKPASDKAVEIAPYKIKRTWNNVLDGLIEGHYDVVATPLFATFDRSKRVRFTAPLFFSNVGLYMTKDMARVESLFKDLTVNNLAAAMREGNLRCLSVEGEISEKLAQKYSDEELVIPIESGVLLSSLFNDIAHARDQRTVLFCESFFAHQQREVISGEVVNVLLPNEILYPVCFAVRLGDYQLANLLNIRLLQLTRKDGVIDLLAQKLSKAQGKQVDLSEVKQHFVSEWPTTSDVTRGVHV